MKRNSIGLRLLIIGILIVVLLIPSALISALVSEREERKREAITEITSKWAASQTVGGPVLTIPYQKTWRDEKGKVQISTAYIQVLPDLLQINGSIKPEVRYRGIYKAILYNSKLNVSGVFSLTKLKSLNLPPQSINWNDAFVAILVPDMRGIKEYVVFNWNGNNYPLESGIKTGNDFFSSGVSLKVPVNQAGPSQYKFSFLLNLNGSEELSFLPLGQKTTLQLDSNWNAPSFDGAFLPEKRQVTKDGFTARWEILDLNRNYAQVWEGGTNSDTILNSKFGVKLFSPVDEYTKTMRSIKYLIMFVSLTFLIFFLVEVFNRKRIHPIQYLLIGFSLCIFYILLLSLTEHLNFELAYLISSLAITALITTYVKSVLGAKSLTLTTALLLLTLYGFLYILLQNQDYALLMGSIGIFLIMAAVMYLSRNINWYQIEDNQPLP